jgi:hypothetical protein
MSITPVYLSIKTLDFPCYAGLPLSSSELPDNIILLFQPPGLSGSKSHRKSVGISEKFFSLVGV